MNTRELSQILMNIPCIGRERTKKIVTFFREGMELLPMIRHLYPYLNLERSHLDEAVQKAAAVFLNSEQQQVDLCCFTEQHYPRQLLTIGDFPPLIYTIGNSHVMNRPLGAALIGSRTSPESILKFTEIIGEILISYGFTIVSGLARGCDTAAHMTAIRKKSYTMAVMPCGPDRVYPGENRFLYNQILEKQGLVLSEYEPGIPPAPFRFVQRDRLQSGLSTIVVLMESKINGGSMHASISALIQKRPVLIYVPDRFNESNSGNRYLLGKKGVYPFSNSDDFNHLMKNIRNILRDCNRQTDQLIFPYA